MRTKMSFVMVALMAAACGSSTPSRPGNTDTGGTGGGDGGSGGGATGGSTGGAGGSTGGTGVEAVGDAAAPPADTLPGGSPDTAPQTGTGGSSGGKVLYVAGEKPMVGNDGLIHDALKMRGLEVTDVTTATVTPAMAEGKSLMIVSYSLQSGSFKGADYADLKVPIIVLEHNVLPQLGMTDGGGHGFVGGGNLTIVGTDTALTAGLTGDVSVYGPAGKEMFWGVPGPGAIKVATAKGGPERSFYFVYPAGAMMATRPAAGKRVHFFFAVHSPPPVPTLYLNDNGVKLLGGALDWMLK
jgi:hypothetical protein